MRLIQNKLYLTFSEMVECGVSEEYLKKAKSIGTKCWHFINDPDDKRKVLVGYDELKEQYKQIVQMRFGNPYDHVARQPILDMILNDAKANAFFLGYRYEDAKHLPIATVNKYTRAAGWLNMLRDLDLQVVRKTLGLSMDEFRKHTAILVALEKERGKNDSYTGLDVLPGDFPSSAQRLMARVEKYAAAVKDQGEIAGYESIIDDRFGNKNASKIGKITAASTPAAGVKLPAAGSNKEVQVTKNEVNALILCPKTENKAGGFDPELAEKQTAVIRYCAAIANNLDAGQVTKMVNIVFSQNGWETLSVRTISKFIKENEHVLTPGRKGKRSYMNKVAMQNKRKAPSFPMVYWTLDGWTAELYYREGNVYGRLVVVVVLDPFNKYPIGYAVGDREDTALIKAACRNALEHTKALFGEVYQPLQLQSDNYQIKNLTPFYQAVKGLYFTPAAVGNSKAKTIEPYFMYLNKEYCQSRCSNWSGFNVDANRENQANKEWLNMIKKQFPDKEAVARQIEDIICHERKLKVQDYVAKWAELPAEDKKVMGQMDYLMVFGERLGERTSSITGQGVEKQIAGMKFVFDSFDPLFRANLHVKWELFGDMHNLDQVLAVSPDSKLRFVLHQKRELPMDLYSTTQADVDYRKKIEHYNNDRMKAITELYGRDADATREIMDGLAITDAEEATLKLMPTINGKQKDAIQDAKRLGTGRKLIEQQKLQEQTESSNEWEQQRMAFLSHGIDFSEFGAAE